MLDAVEQRIANVLYKNGATQTQVEMYLEDIFSYSNKDLYENLDEETILIDFEDWLGEEN